MIEIPLTQGMTAIIDDQDAELVAGYTWHAAHVHQSFYAQTRVVLNGRPTSLQMHRLIMQPKLGEQVVHVDGNGLNNCRSNMRTCSKGERVPGRRRQRRNRTGFIGVFPHHRKFIACIGVGKKQVYLGLFKTAAEAAAARDEAARKQHGDLARLNFPT